MNNLTKTLLTGVALCALGAVPAIALTAGQFHVTALHGDRLVNKTKLHNRGAVHITYTFGIYTYVPASTPLGTTFSKSQQFCPAPQKVKVTPKKTKYGKTSVDVVTYSGCALITGKYKLVKQPSPGDTDAFALSVASKFENSGTKYKETLNIEVNIEFD